MDILKETVHVLKLEGCLVSGVVLRESRLDTRFSSLPWMLPQMVLCVVETSSLPQWMFWICECRALAILDWTPGN